MNDEALNELLKLARKEEILAKIIVWLKTKGLFEECFKIVAPDLLELREKALNKDLTKEVR